MMDFDVRQSAVTIDQNILVSCGKKHELPTYRFYKIIHISKVTGEICQWIYVIFVYYIENIGLQNRLFVL